MDSRLEAISGSMNAINFDEERFSTLLDRTFGDEIIPNDPFVDEALIGSSVSLNDLYPWTAPSVINQEGDLHDDLDFSDEILKYINQMLMGENIEDKFSMFQEPAALEAAEKSFYDALVENDPPPSSYEISTSLHCDVECPDKINVADYGYAIGSGCSPGPSWDCDVCDTESPHVQNAVINIDSQSRSQSSPGSLSSDSNVRDGYPESPVSILGVSSSPSDGTKGFEEANVALIEKTESNTKKQHEKSFLEGPRGKKNPFSSDLSSEGGRSSKLSAVYTDSTESLQMYNEVLLCAGGKHNPEQCEFHQCRVAQNILPPKKIKPKGTKGGKARGKEQDSNKDMVDLYSLLTLCAQAVASNDQRNATELLKQIREHSSPTGDGLQRLAHYFSIGLEDRNAGSGTENIKQHVFMPTSAADILKAYRLYLEFCPFRKISNFFANKTIMHTAENNSCLHIIDFGILHGFQWPCLIQRLSYRPGGPPKIRITGIDFPCPGFRPSERVEATGRRLAAYAETFGVPFEFKAIAQQWETIKLDDLNIVKGETLAVNCAYRLKNLLDDSVVLDSPRNIVLSLIRKLNPDVFVLGIINGSYNSPFFNTRFKEALFHFSSLFDMLDANVPREVHERMLIEKIIWGREARNVIACEGGERIERPETYKQWQVRNVRAGFRPLPLNREIMKMAKDRVKFGYNKDFSVDEDAHWMLQGWKGRIIYAMSSWRPAK